MYAAEILKDCETVDCVGIGEGEALLPDYLENIDDLLMVRMTGAGINRRTMANI